MVRFVRWSYLWWVVPAGRGAYDASVPTAEYLVPVVVPLSPNSSWPASLARRHKHRQPVTIQRVIRVAGLSATRTGEVTHVTKLFARDKSKFGTR